LVDVNGRAWASDAEVLNAIAPSQLNKYACDLEDALQTYTQQLGQTQNFSQYQHQVIGELEPHIARYKAMETLLLDPSLLAAYVNDFYTHVHPVETEAEQQIQAQRSAFPQMPTVDGGGTKVNLSDVRPDQRWMVADQMEQAGLFSGKRLVVE
jgi:hypothetical protein